MRAKYRDFDVAETNGGRTLAVEEVSMGHVLQDFLQIGHLLAQLVQPQLVVGLHHVQGHLHLLQEAKYQQEPVVPGGGVPCRWFVAAQICQSACEGSRH